MESSHTIVLTGVLLGASHLVATAFRRIRLPALTGWILVGVLWRVLSQIAGLETDEPGRVFGFLARGGIIVLLFRIGLESNLHELVKNLRSAAFIWVFNVGVSALAAYGVVRYVLHAAPAPSLVVAVAMTATSVGVTVAVWKEAGKLRSREGELLLDVAELDDMSGIALMGMLFVALVVTAFAGETFFSAMTIVCIVTCVVAPAAVQFLLPKDSTREASQQ